MSLAGRQHAFTQTAEKLPSRFPPPHRGTFIELVLSATNRRSHALSMGRSDVGTALTTGHPIVDVDPSASRGTISQPPHPNYRFRID